jgi:hypothetical protein
MIESCVRRNKNRRTMGYINNRFVCTMKRHHHEISNNNENVSHSTTPSTTSWWSRLCDEIRSKGGQVADQFLQFDETSRELRVSSPILTDTVLLQISISSMITQEWALRHYPWLKIMLETDNDFYHSEADIVIAISLAISSLQEMPFLQCLPNTSTLDSLPRRWDEDEVKSLLGNTSVYQRVVKDRTGTRRDYDKIKKVFSRNDPRQQPMVLPSYPAFDDMLAVVTSRAFQIGESTVALVPLLDLCNHSRGKGMKRNVSYQVTKQDGDKNDSLIMTVKSVMDLQPGDVLTLTYGALGNPQLLLNYGFTIPQNLEPDGSSNDVLELPVGGNTCVLLRAGPKSYSYSGLAKAVVAITNQTSPNKSDNLGSTHLHDNGLEGNLYSTMGEDYDEGEFDHLYREVGASDPDETMFNEAGDDIGVDFEALNKLRETLIQKFRAYGNQKDYAFYGSRGHAYFAAILCHSEQRTLFFFVRSVEKILQLLQCRSHNEFDTLDFATDEEDMNAIDEQTTELSKVYVLLRKGLV